MAETLQEFILGITFGKADEKNLDKAKDAARKAAKDAEAAYKAAAKEVEKAQEAVRTASDKTAKKVAQDALAAARAQAKAAKEAATEATKAFKATEKASKEAADVQKANAKRITEAWSTVGKAGAAALAAGVVAGTHALVEQATAIRDWSARLGDGSDTLQEVAGAAKLLGVDSEIAFKAIQKLRVGIGEGTAAGPLAALGLDANALAGMDAREQLAAIASGLQTVGTDAERTAIATRLFGEEGGKLVPVLAGGAEGFADLVAQAEAAGAVLSDDALQAALDFDKQLNKLTITGKAFAASTASDVLPLLTDFSDDVGTLTGALGDLVTAEEDVSDATDDSSVHWIAYVPILNFVAASLYGVATAFGVAADEVRNLDEAINGAAAGARAQVAAELAAKRRDIMISEDLIGQSAVATANVHVQESVRLGKEATKIRDRQKGRKGGSKKKTEIEFTAEDFEFDDQFGDELRRLAERAGATDVALSAAIKAGGESLRAGDNAEVARKAALSRLGSSTGQDFSKTSKDPLLSEIFGENVPDIELSKLAMGAQPQTLIATINNTFNTEIANEINGAGNPADVASQVVQTFRGVIEQTIEKSTKTAGVPWAR